MARIIVTTDHSELPDGAPVLLDEEVRSVHLSTRHAAAQLVQRLAWAVSDAEDDERTRADQRERLAGRSLRLSPPARTGPGVPIGV
jgi:hypothetical protein